MQWLIVSVIVVTCAVFAVKYAIQGIQTLLGYSPQGSDGSATSVGSPCGGCGGCKKPSANNPITIVEIGSKIRT
ncbi:MAG: hypothetical protein MUF23_02945 [Pirellula sp.]|jgi:hypothetical protein|nr:hypothetical protein [Pirellula sp.]